MNKILIASLVTIGIGLLLFTLISIKSEWYLTIHEGIHITEGTGNIVTFYKNNEEIYKDHNNMTTNGKEYLNAKLFNTSWAGAAWSYIEIGNGTDDGDPTNNAALIATWERQNATAYKPTAAQWGLNYTFSFNTSLTIKEAGVYNADAAGELIFYIGNLNIGVTSADTLLINWKGTTSGS